MPRQSLRVCISSLSVVMIKARTRRRRHAARNGMEVWHEQAGKTLRFE